MGLEIISGVERRRRRSVADKLRIVAEAQEAGAEVAEPGLIPNLEARITSEYRPTPWSATARAVLNALV